MKVFFTIVASNYVAMAEILGSTLNQIHPDIDFFIFIADPMDPTIGFSSNLRYKKVFASNLQINNIEEMAFKYNVTEFCTALKPFAFEYLFGKSYEKVIYLDPDIAVFSSLESIFIKLESSSLVVTPHFCTIEADYSGIVPESMILGVGIFNFGFCAITNSKNGLKIIEWWKIRLQKYCFGDKIESLHTDQKWMDFMPSLIPDTYIERGLGYNVAFWNIHERELFQKDNKLFYVKNRIIKNSNDEPLVFFHFSNFNFNNSCDLDSFPPVYLSKYNDIKTISDYYANLLNAFNFPDRSKASMYAYNKFDNNTEITFFHRRLYRRLIEEGEEIKSPFISKGPISFYNILKKNNLIAKPLSLNQRLDKANELNFPGFQKKLKIIKVLLTIIQRLIGINRYALLCKFMQRFLRPENQTFLLGEIGKNIPFYNENRYINWKKTIDDH